MMVDITKIALRVIALIVGLICIYSALFLYENEQGKVQSTLEDWWLRIDEKQHSWLSRHTTFMREVADLVGRAFDQLFGKRIISFQSVSVSTCYSIASFGLALILLKYILKIPPMTLSLLEISFGFNVTFNFLKDPTIDIFAIICMIAWIAGFLTLGNLPALVSARRIKRPFLITLLLSVLGPMTFILWASVLHVIDSRKSLIVMSIALIGGAISDTVFVAITRKILRWTAGLDSFIKIAGSIVLNCAIAVLFIAGPISFLFISLDIDFIPVAGGPPEIGSFSAPLHTQIILLFSLIAMTNLMIAVCVSAFIVFALVMVVHRVLWPVVARPTYALQRVGIARRSKLLGTMGIILLGFAMGVVPDWLKQLVDKFNS